MQLLQYNVKFLHYNVKIFNKMWNISNEILSTNKSLWLIWWSRFFIQHSLRDEGWIPLIVDHCFFSIFYNSREINGQAVLGTFDPRLYNSYNHCPGARPAHVAESRPLARFQLIQTSGSRIFISLFRGEPCQCKIAADEIWKAEKL